MSYLRRSGSAEWHGQTMLGGGRAGAGEALSFPFSSREALVSQVGCEACLARGLCGRR